MSKTKIYNRIKVALAEAGKQNMELAKYVGVHITTVSDWCTNTNQPSVQHLFKIAEFLKVDVRTLLLATNWEETGASRAAEEKAVFNRKAPAKKTAKKTKAAKKRKTKKS